uniref:Prefoldin subunit 2 n=1 Tax=Fibrocapsa japonica TaxID=94617 RepID=A0A7S2UUA6_9STRA|mmetsp:Transcript_13826/g.20368  ORF Transcript_13826/g.20368 Transcript_13826/m.20368 type:complete len:151 (+) Transcript_13826:241-693(+)|eukprot:CAMPEP_0113936460 /NCGR_PEP_ID=MMETSP1339-20121228/3371_1 /TAXON_ID=94617 /ORGANISM="Fibrocapsa japonica" /LENGTH=150 /DNA_ID=CAMNT_0000938949 /DNA_START=207 /DNA_END=662 /DNA_ORIENTATION=+ /assembly_acc=CAM_ASM_000762
MASFTQEADEKKTQEQEEPKLTEREIVARFQYMMADLKEIQSKIRELMFEEDEHKLVLETLGPLEPDRKAFHLSGGILVEQTVAEAMPKIQANFEGIQKIRGQLEELLKRKAAETDAWRVKYGIRTQKEHQMQQGSQEKKDDQKATGVLA